MTNDIKVRCVAPVGDHCGEGATWSAAEQAIYWTDVCRFLVHRMVIATGAVESWYFDEPCVALALTDRPGTLVLGLGSRVILWEPASDRRTDYGFAVEGAPGVRLNEGGAGPSGEFWIGSMANNVGPNGEHGGVTSYEGALFRLSHDAAARTVRRDIGVSNTLCFSPDQRFMYSGDSLRNVIWRYDYDAVGGSISGEAPFFEGFARGGPDGSAIDAEGYLWNCRFGGGCVVRVAPDGSVDQVIEMPVSNITTCEFGGPDLKTLYVTTAASLLDHHEQFAGSLFALDLSVRGGPTYHHRLGPLA